MRNAARVGALSLIVGLGAVVVHGQDAEEEPIGIGDVRLGTGVSALPFPCADPVVCEAPYASAWIRVWHADGMIQRIDVIYAGGKGPGGEEIEGKPITLAQAIKTHSIWNGRKAPRLGLAGNTGAQRVLVDVANGVSYFANGATPESRVSEVRYVPITDPVVASASNSMLSKHGQGLIQAAWTTERYKNPPAGQKQGESEAVVPGEQSTRQELSLELHNMSKALSAYAKATLTLSGHVSESLKKNEKPDQEVSANLKKAYARLTESTHEALVFLSAHPGMGTPEDIEGLPLDLAGQAEDKMNELIELGFSN